MIMDELTELITEAEEGDRESPAVAGIVVEDCFLPHIKSFLILFRTE